MGSQAHARTAAVLGSALLLGSLAVTTVTLATSAASPRCGSLPATIVGTARGETIVGTAGADIIAALGGDDTVRGLGGADRICGGGGDDTLIGGTGKDKLLGDAGDDGLNGGGGLDTCLQGAGRGAIRACESPGTAPAPAPVPAPAPAPAPPPDSDGDGVTDDVDACPAQGASAWGLDGSGCPKPPPPPTSQSTFQSTCVDAGGTYVPGPVLRNGVDYEQICDWNGISYSDFESAISLLDPFCAATSTWAWGLLGDPDWMGCRDIT